MYRIMNITVYSDSELYDWADHIAHLTNNLYNAALFRQRQMMLSAKKPVTELHKLEQQVIDEVSYAVALMNAQIGSDRKKLCIGKSGVLTYKLLDCVMKCNEDPDYLADGLPRQTAQAVLKQVCHDITSYFHALREYKKNPSSFTGRPKMPRYKHKKGICSFIVTNQDAVVRQNKKGNYQLKLPLTKLVLPLGKSVPGRLMEVHITPVNGSYQFSLVFDCAGIEAHDEVLALRESKRVASIDIGVDNLMTITNNVGLPSMIITGRPLKSINQWYNKKIAAMMSEQTKLTKQKFVPTTRYYELTNKRNNQINNYLFCASKYLIQWCVDNRIDTIVIGKNDGWKQRADMGTVNNQKFVQIPFARLINIIHYSANRNLIRVILQEESYTSKASYLDVDYIPTFGDGNKHKFSGKRIMRGMYQSKNDIRINADVNGSANIMRKALPGLHKLINYWQIVVVNPVKALARPNPKFLPATI